MARRAFQVVDLGFGDSGKGTIVDYLCARHDADLVVRFNGGPQAGHNVVLPDGRHHTFAQFGSGMFLPGVATLLSRFMLIEPYAMLNEAAHLSDLGVANAMERTLVDERCRVITPPQQIANRLRERARGANQHGSCGMGVGECVGDALTRPDVTLHARDLADRATARRKLRAGLEAKRAEVASLYSHIRPEERHVFEDATWIDVALDVYADVARYVQIVSDRQASRAIASSRRCVFEGAQGVLLDENHGFAPHVTWSTTTYANADALLDEAGGDVERLRIGVMRTYLTRHGAGPFVTEDRRLDAPLPEPHNGDDGMPGRFRRGLIDFVMLRYAIGACKGIDALAITCMDRLRQLPSHACDAYDLNEPSSGGDILASDSDRRTDRLARAKPRYRHLPTDDPKAFVSAVESALQVPVRYQSTGPARLDKREIHTG